MKHFVGGFGLGFFIGMGMIKPGKDKAIQCLIVASTLGLAAWGLLP